MLIYHCNIRFPYKIRRVIRNIYINIVDLKGKRLCNGGYSKDYIWRIKI